MIVAILAFAAGAIMGCVLCFWILGTAEHDDVRDAAWREGYAQGLRRIAEDGAASSIQEEIAAGRWKHHDAQGRAVNGTTNGTTAVDVEP
jgi:hypothetical protein